MNNECGNTNGIFTCNKQREHIVAHGEIDTETGRYRATWPQRTFAKGGVIKNCTSTHVIPDGPGHGSSVTCQLRDGHPGSHLRTFLTRSTVQWRQWYDTTDYSKFGMSTKFALIDEETRPEETPALQFTTHELAELYVILSGNHEIPAVYLNKIGAALKKML